MDDLNLPGSPEQDFPLLTLSPVDDARHAWSALLLGGDAADPGYLPAMVRLFGQFGLGEALPALPCLLPLADPEALDDALAAQLPAEDVILLVPLSLALDPAAALSRLRNLGFRLMAAGLPAAEQNLPAEIDSVAGDGSIPPPPRLPGPHLATGVNEPGRFAAARSAGYGWFAGDYPLHPAAGNKTKGGSSRALLLRLLAMVAADAPSRDIEALLKQDPALSYHLLKLVNSVSFALTTPITSFGYAITLLGRRQLQRWLQLLIYAQQGKDTGALMARAAYRAGLMEALCQRVGGSKEDQEHAFMTGMFSLLDVLFGTPLEQIIAPLNLAAEVEDALLNRGGWLGGLLDIVERSGRAPQPSLAGQLAQVLLTPAAYAQAQVEACRWATRIGRES